MERLFNNRLCVIVSLILMWLGLTAITIYYLKLNMTPLSFDASAYLQVSGLIGQQLSHANIFNALKIFIYHDMWANRPGLFMLIGGVFATLTHFNICLTILFNNMFWYGLLVVLTYKIAEFCYKKTGLLAVFMVVTSYGFIYMYRNFLVDVPLTVGVLLSVLFFLKFDNCRTTKSGFIYCISLVFGALIKETFVLYVLPIFIYDLYTFYKSFIKTDIFDKKRFKMMLFIYLGAFFAVTLFYFPILVNLIKNMVDNVGSTVGKYYSRSYSKNSVNYYLVYLYLLSFITSVWYILLPLFGMVLNKLFHCGGKTSRDKKGVYTGFLLLVCAVPIFILTICVTDTDNRFILPILPIILIISAGLTVGITRVLKLIIVFLIVCVGIANFVSSFMYISFLPKFVNYGSYVIFAQRYLDNANGLRYGFTQIDQDWSISKILDSLKNQANGKHITVACLDSMLSLNNNILASYASFKYPNLVFFGVDSVKELQYGNYIVTSTKKLTDDPKLSIYKLSEVNQYIFEQVKQNRFSIVNTFPLPNGGKVYIIKM